MWKMQPKSRLKNIKHRHNQFNHTQQIQHTESDFEIDKEYKLKFKAYIEKAVDIARNQSHQ